MTAKLRKNSQNARIIRALADGRWRSSAAIQRRVGPTRLPSRISELRKFGFEIEHQQRNGAGPKAHWYQLKNPPAPSEIEKLFQRVTTDTMDRDSTPRNRQHRYRIYRVVYDELELVGTAATPAQLGKRILELGAAGVFARSCMGINDTHGTDAKPGAWVINPWDVNP